MAKMNRAEVVLLDRENSLGYKIQAEQTPRKTEPGVYLYLKVNQAGIQFLQEKIGVDDFVSTKALEKWFCKGTGMPETGLGSLGNIKTDEGKNNWGITINGNETGVSAVEPVAVAEPMVAVTPIPADTTEDPMVAKIQEYRTSGKIADEQIKESLVAKVGTEKAEQLWKSATEVKEEKVELF